jgi:5-methylcytosine-specific restriction endonuclease McrA
MEALTNASKMRLQVLRRDHYKCRVCHWMGDEITLEVHPVCPSAASIDNMFTICARCRNLIETWAVVTARSFREPAPALLSSRLRNEKAIFL